MSYAKVVVYIVLMLVINGCANKNKYVKIDSVFINQTNNQTLLGKYKDQCPSSLQNKNLSLKLSYDDKITSPVSSSYDSFIMSPTSEEVFISKYKGDFKHDIELELKNIFADICHSTFDDKLPSGNLNIDFKSFNTHDMNHKIIDRSFSPFAMKVNTKFNTSAKYDISSFIDGDVLASPIDYKRSYSVNKTFDMESNGLTGEHRNKSSLVLKSLMDDSTIFNLNIKRNAFMMNSDASIQYSLQENENKIIKKGEPSCSTSADKILIKGIEDFELLYMLYGVVPGFKIHLLDTSIYDESASHKYYDVSDKYDGDNADGMFAFMLYDLSKNIIENAR